MLKKQRPISTFLIISLSFILPLAFAYSNYNDLVETDFFTRGAKFEAVDLNNLWIDKQTDLDFMPGESLLMAPPESTLRRFLTLSSFEIIASGSSLLVLRC